ncbi:hypothetical protein ACCI51_12720 [Microbulbifer echini]|uniref:XRE family transcriptional regulator n=1 Tax=Microbulbifer echini TaxID=1529067 RepID=A0ABV4NPV8_9GAMM
MLDQNIRQAFGKRLKELSKQRVGPKGGLANKLDIHYTHLNKYESGIHAPPLPLK